MVNDGAVFFQGFVRMEGLRGRQYLVIKKDKFCYYNTFSVSIIQYCLVTTTLLVWVSSSIVWLLQHF